jgi:hypothetical protein
MQSMYPELDSQENLVKKYPDVAKYLKDKEEEGKGKEDFKQWEATKANIAEIKKAFEDLEKVTTLAEVLEEESSSSQTSHQGKGRTAAEEEVAQFMESEEQGEEEEEGEQEELLEEGEVGHPIQVEPMETGSDEESGGESEEV